MDNEKIITHWVESSDKDYTAMISNLETKNYTWALFIGHLVLEKLLKALYAKTHPDKPQAPYIHNLMKLTDYCGLDVPREIDTKLGVINTFNMRARYESEKHDFYVKCTKEYTEQQIKNIKEVRIWLKEKLMRN